MSETAVDNLTTSRPDASVTKVKIVDAPPNPLPTPTTYVNQQLIDQLEKMRRVNTTTPGDLVPPPKDSQLRRNNLAILTKSIIRHLTNLDDIKKHLGSPAKIKTTLQKDILPRVKSIVSPEHNDNLLINSEQRLGLDYVELKTHPTERPIASVAILPPGVQFSYEFVDQSKHPWPNWGKLLDRMGEQGKKVICIKTGSTYEKIGIKNGEIIRIPSFGTIRQVDGQLTEVIPFMDRDPKDHIQHGGFILTSDSIEIVDFQTLKRVFEDVRNGKVDPSILVAYQGDWYADQKSFAEIASRPNMQQSNNFNVVGQFILSDGTSRYFMGSTDLTSVDALFKAALEAKKLLKGVVDIKMLGLEFLGGGACFVEKGNGKKELIYIDTPDQPLEYYTSDLIKVKPDFLIAFMPPGL